MITSDLLFTNTGYHRGASQYDVKGRLEIYLKKASLDFLSKSSEAIILDFFL